MRKNPSLNPSTFLAQAALRFPRCWEGVDVFRPEYMMKPDYVYLPSMAYDFNILYKILGEKRGTFHQIFCLAGLGAWRATQGIYQFDPDLYEALVNTEIGSLPAEVFVRLPEWCIYIELINECWCSGAFAFLDYTSPDCLYLVLLIVKDNEFDNLWPFRLQLNCSLKEAILRSLEFIETAKKAHHAKGFDLNLYYSHLKRIVSLVLYICSENADLSSSPSKPAPTQTKHGPRWFPPKLPTKRRVGFRQGPKLKRALEFCRSEGESADASATSTVIPHVRRAHWHHYWIGPKEKRELIPKWLPPILVNVDEADDLIPSLRTVEEP